MGKAGDVLGRQTARSGKSKEVGTLGGAEARAGGRKKRRQTCGQILGRSFAQCILIANGIHAMTSVARLLHVARLGCFLFLAFVSHGLN